MSYLAIYGFYFCISLWITWFLGNHLHKNGLPWIAEMISDLSIAHRINDLLLLLYRLFNGGTLLYTVMAYDVPTDFLTSFTFITSRIGFVLLASAYLHYQNVGMIIAYSFTLKSYLK